jgi:Pyruvate/2-oxoacid:ferredoxin oxidoreductase gamma subunit
MIGSPVVLNPDVLIAMNRTSLERFQPYLKNNGQLFFDSSLISSVAFRDNVFPVGIPATKIADSMGDTRTANMVMLGGLIAATRVLKKSTLKKIFSFPAPSVDNRTAEVNKNSILEGIDYLENKKSHYF